jgi:hypothetical protein
MYINTDNRQLPTNNKLASRSNIACRSLSDARPRPPRAGQAVGGKNEENFARVAGSQVAGVLSPRTGAQAKLRSLLRHKHSQTWAAFGAKLVAFEVGASWLFSKNLHVLASSATMNSRYAMAFQGSSGSL